MPWAPPKHRPPGWRPPAPKPTDQFYGSSTWKRMREFVLQRDGGVCARCGAPESNHVDHIRPRSRGGRDVVWNLRVLCTDCDAKRHAEKGSVWRLD
jgi:5-methylcytosine-specific restriction protein A